MCSVCAVASGEDETLPQSIYMKTLSRGFSYEYLYALKDGKIWTKPNTSNTGVEGEWTLFEGTGVPHGAGAKSFGGHDSITAFSTEGTMIVALSEKRRFYFWQPTIKEKTTWADMNGAPVENALFLPKCRTWCFSMSLMRAPWKRLTPMHENDIVSYWEDADGNRTEFGFTATIYVVDPDGQRIRYTDTGLPMSWHKAFASPERGRFIIEEISAAASTVFVVNRTGKMYTRMMDYEMEGGCPALKFVYEHGKRTRGDEIAPLMKAVRTLPLPDWRVQEAIEPVLNDRTGKACVTCHITIVLTGKGNSARELRVRGRDAHGEYGYWRKPVFGKEWDFVATGERFDDRDIITDYLSDAPAGRPLDKNFRGSVKKYGQPDLPVELVGFYYYNTPAIIRFNAGGKSNDIIFHTVDQWSPTEQKKFYPELVGNPAGEPKLLQGTIEIPGELLESGEPEVKKIIDTYFREYNLVPLAFKVSADDGKVLIRSRTVQRNLKNNMNYEVRKRVTMEFVSEDAGPTGVKKDMFYTSIANLPVLEIPEDWQNFTAADISRIDECIDMNKKSLRELENLRAKFRSENLKGGGISAMGSTVFYIFNGIVNLIGLPYWNDVSDDPGVSENVTQLGGVSYTGGTAMNEYAIMNLELSSRNPEDYNRAVKIIKDRVKLLTDIRKKLAAKK